MSYVVKKLLKLSKLNYLVCRIISAKCYIYICKCYFLLLPFSQGVAKGLSSAYLNWQIFFNQMPLNESLLMMYKYECISVLQSHIP